MARKKLDGAQKYTVRLYQSDIAFLQEHFPTFAFTDLVRTMINQQVKKLKEIKNVAGNSTTTAGTGLNIDALFKEIHGVERG